MKFFTNLLFTIFWIRRYFAVKIKGTNEVVFNDINVVSRKIAQSQSFDKDNFRNKICEEYDFSWNEQYCLSELGINEDDIEAIDKIKEALLKGKRLDEDEAELIVGDTEEFYKKALALFRISDRVFEVELIQSSDIIDELTIYYEYAKISPMYNVPSSVVEGCLLDPKKAKQDLSVKQTALLRTLLKLNSKEEEVKLLFRFPTLTKTILSKCSVKIGEIGDLKSGEIDAQLPKYLIQNFRKNSAIKMTAILQILFENKVFDEAVWSREVESFEPTAHTLELMSMEEYGAKRRQLVNAIVSLRREAGPCLLALKYNNFDYEKIKSFSIWANCKRLSFPLIKAILLNNEIGAQSILHSMQINEISRLTEDINDDNEVSTTIFKFLTEDLIEQLHAMKVERGQLNYNQVKLVLMEAQVLEAEFEHDFGDCSDLNPVEIPSCKSDSDEINNKPIKPIKSFKPIKIEKIPIEVAKTVRLVYIEKLREDQFRAKQLQENIEHERMERIALRKSMILSYGFNFIAILILILMGSCLYFYLNSNDETEDSNL